MLALAAALAGQTNWHMLKAPQRPVLIAACVVAGFILSIAVTLPFYDWLSIEVFGARPQKFNAGINLDETRLTPFLISDFVMTLIVAPVVEEYLARGVLAERLANLPRWQIALWCISFFCVVHYMGCGLMKVAFVLPMSIAFTAIRMLLGSWKYPMADHVGANPAAALVFYRLL